MKTTDKTVKLQNTNQHRLPRDTPERTIVVLLNHATHLRAQRRIIERATQMNWRIVDLSYYKNQMPDNLVPDGALIECLWDSALAKQLRKIGCPTIRIGRFPHPKDHVFPSVVSDLTKIGRLAAEHFAERNFRHVGFIGYHIDVSHFKHLYDPFCSRATELGCDCQLLEFSQLTGKQKELPHIEKQILRDIELSKWLENIPKPIGILGFSDNQSARICVRSLDLGFSVPGDIAVVSCGNDPMICECTPIRLSALSTGGPEEGDVATALLQEMMDGKPAPKSTVLVAPKRLTVRESSDVLATTDPEANKAVHFIWANLRENLSVDDISDAAGCPRRKLERAFRRQFGRGVNAELLRRRLDYCCELLQSTKLPVVDIVPMIGFRSAAYLHTVFRRKFGMTPTAWREDHADIP